MKNGKFKSLVEAFAKAGLVLQILLEPIARGGRNMSRLFQMDIKESRKGDRRSEVFRMYVGNDKAVIQVRDVDLKHKQLVLVVNEPVIEFESERKITRWNTEKFIMDSIDRARGVRFSRKVGDTIYFAQKTEAGIRYFLLGVDERQLFISQLTAPATTVKAARALLGKTVQFAEGTRRNSVDRQGEWFFLETTQGVRDIIDFRIKRNEAVVKTKTNIGDTLGRRGGNPHVVDELVVLSSGAVSKDKKFVRTSGRRVFIRGAIRHKDHKTIKFNHWREVVANNEGGNAATGQMGTGGIFWVD